MVYFDSDFSKFKFLQDYFCPCFCRNHQAITAVHLHGWCGCGDRRHQTITNTINTSLCSRPDIAGRAHGRFLAAEAARIDDRGRRHDHQIYCSSNQAGRRRQLPLQVSNPLHNCDRLSPRPAGIEHVVGCRHAGCSRIFKVPGALHTHTGWHRRKERIDAGEYDLQDHHLKVTRLPCAPPTTSLQV